MNMATTGTVQRDPQRCSFCGRINGEHDDSCPAFVQREKALEHQSQMKPEDNKFHKGNGSDGKHYWITPPELYAELDEKYSFDFDPCPFPKPDEFDGLTCEWGKSSYVNPPFGSIMHTDPITGKTKKKGATAWARKAIEENKKGKRVVLVHPMDKWVLMLIEAGAKIANLGDVKWLATEDGSEGKGTGRHIACFVLDNKAALTAPPHVPQDTHPLTEVREALALADAALSGANMNMSVIEKRVKSALATLDRVIEGDGWLPIETLPADCKPLGNPRYLTYHKDWGYGINGEQMLNGASPTHWRPLPTPPEAK